MKTKNFIWLIAIVAVIAIGLNYYLSPKTTEKLSPSQTADSFYQSWVEYEGNPISSKIYLDSSYLSESLKTELTSIIESFDGFGAYDPVLCAQEKPESISSQTLEEGDNSAELKMTLDFFGQERFINLKMIKESDVWQIDQINCLNPEEMAINFIIDNISDLSPEPEVLGGTFYVTNIETIGNNLLLVDYEDGHIALQAEVEYSLGDMSEIVIDDFTIINNYKQIKKRHLFFKRSFFV